MTVNNNHKNQRFIPFTRSDLVEMCLDREDLDTNDQIQFRGVCKMLRSILHFEFDDKLESLKNAYTPVNPNTSTRTYKQLSEDELNQGLKRFVTDITEVLNDANYERIEKEELERALEKESLFLIRLQIDFDDFDQYLLFRRGISLRRERIRPWYAFKSKEIEFESYDRVVMYIHFKDQEYFEQKNRKDILFKPGSAMLKMFQNVPVHDVEMLFPNTRVRMRTTDKLLIGVPATIGGLVMVVTKLGASLALVVSFIIFWIGFTNDEPKQLDQKQLLALGGGLAALGAYLFRQWGKFKNRRIKFLKTLTESLYFRNLDNNMGVIFRLINNAEEEECKEALLAYYFLLINPDGLTQSELDEQIESWFRENFECDINFEIDDALNKLKRLKLVIDQDGVLRGIDAEDAMKTLDFIWDNYFQHN